MAPKPAMTIRFVAILLGAILGLGQSVFGQTEEGAQRESWGKLRGITVSEDFEDVAFRKVFERLQVGLVKSGSAVRIAFDANVVEQMLGNPAAYAKSGITLELRDVSMEKALDQVCAAFNVRWVGSGDWVVIRAMTTGITIKMTTGGAE